MKRVASRWFAGISLAALIAGCAASTGDEATSSESEAFVTPLPPKVPIYKTVTLTAGQIGGALAVLFMNTKIQISQDGDPTHAMHLREWGCTYESTASLNARKAACRDSCEDGLTPVDIATCVKACAALTPTCTYECGDHAEGSFIDFDSLLEGRGSQPYSAQDCQTKNPDDSTEPAIYDRRLDVPNPIYARSYGSCRMMNLSFVVKSNVASATGVDASGIHMYVDGQSASPALACNGYVPDMDLGNIVLAINMLPRVGQGGTLAVSAGAELHAAVTAHNPVAAGIIYAFDVQSQVLAAATAQFTGRVAALDGPIAQGIDALVRSSLPPNGVLNGYERITSHADGSVTFYYF